MGHESQAVMLGDGGGTTVWPTAIASFEDVVGGDDLKKGHKGEQGEDSHFG